MGSPTQPSPAAASVSLMERHTAETWMEIARAAADISPGGAAG
ncbi:hypothetical protein AB0H86_20835 [Streptomyces sp. NPDC050997]